MGYNQFTKFPKNGLGRVMIMIKMTMQWAIAGMGCGEVETITVNALAGTVFYITFFIAYIII